MKKILLQLGLLCFATSICFAGIPQKIDSAVAYIYSNQSVNGSWNSTTTSVKDTTAEVLNSLARIGKMESPYSNGLNWLNAQIESDIDFQARIITLSNSASNLNILLSDRNQSGGWATFPAYFNDTIIDTALALQALKAANYSDTTVLYQAINFLTTNQNVDGGWGYRSANGALSSDPSNAYVTSIALRAVAGLSSQFSVQSSISRASAYLLTKQNTDGGFGSSPSNAYETALSVISLIESGQNSTQPLQNAISYLVTAQSTTNGSWNNDPYSTALALQALASARANLVITSSDISLSKSMPQESETITITATVHNAGLDNASNMVVRFYLGDPAAGGIQIGTDQVIPILVVGGTAQASITASFTGTGGKTIFVIADPDGLISETSKADNKASARLWVATGPDLAVLSEDLKPSTYVPATGTAFTFEYTIRNLGETEAGQFSVALYDGPSTGASSEPQPNSSGQAPWVGGTLLQTASISGIPGNGSRTGTFGVTLSTDGPHTLYLVADTLGEIAELSETNNKASATVTVGGTTTGADLAVTPADITFTPGRPAAGEAIQIAARVRNQGTDAAFGFLVEIYDGQPESGGSLIHSQTISLASGSDQAVTASWTPAAGIHDIQVIVDRENKIVETNNMARWKRT